MSKNLSWKIGDATVTRIEEQLGPGSFSPDQYFIGFEPQLLDRHLSWLAPNHYLPGTNELVTSVHSWLVRTRHHTILVDACSGNHKDRHWWPRFHQLQTPYLERLAAAGVAPEQVDMVMCTHLHADHIGWNTQLKDGRWVPTFPNARYLFSRKECEHWDPERNPAGADDPHRRIAYQDSVLPVIEAGLAELVSGPHVIDDELLIEDAPGHTPGHILLKLRHPSGGGVFCGDVIHHPLQVYAPHWVMRFCEDHEQSRATRRRVLEHCADTGALLLPTHFGAPHVAAIRRTAEAFEARWVAPGD
ncbi:MBL fold metallo-hydrolase [Ramlibacter rhizophilus]|uniref:MBL fold metallo-hydrolase n=1 Tax=Ramlibacter rhizophilus TaxID=1781167 RepID=A0A4Z0BG62_9BURK|nr:MBL fold metallo-hydrolase [Ramlibacter rhizophilus]TFY97443.1 MBL fold metallo-hydrolase [Ramlibacter rhizophilus]